MSFEFDGVHFIDEAQRASYVAMDGAAQKAFRDAHPSLCDRDYNRGPMRPPVKCDIVIPSLPRESTSLDAALRYVEHGIAVLVADPKTKKPLSSAVNDSVNVRAMFNDRSPGVAAQLGAPSRGLTDFDFEWPEVASIAGVVAGNLPAFGRPGAPSNHRMCICPEARAANGDCRLVQYLLPMSMRSDPRLPEGEHKLCVAELRANGHQSTLPPTSHPAGGGRSWSTDLSFPELTWEQCRQVVGLAALLGCVQRFYPHGLAAGSGGLAGHIFLALGGVLLRALKEREPFKENEDHLIKYVDDLVCQVAMLCGDKDHRKRRHANKTLARIKNGQAAMGLTKLMSLLGLPKEMAGISHGWLGAEDVDERALIYYDEKDLTDMLAQAQQGMLDSDVEIYQRGGRIVCAYRTEAKPTSDDDVVRQTGSLVIGGVNRHQIRVCMTDAARFKQFVPFPKPHWKFVAPPLQFCETFLSWNRGWKVLPLEGISSIPFLRKDGTLCDTEGYDSKSAVLVDFNGETFDPIPSEPTKEQALGALSKLKEPYEEFPFALDNEGEMKRSASRSVALSATLSVIGRTAMRTVPMHGFNAPVMATGKTLCANVTSHIATGRDAAAMTLGWNEDENEKRLTGVLLGGDRVLLMDNIKRPVNGDLLNVMLTSDSAQVRTLGKTGQTEVPCGVTILATGNSLQFDGDMISRCVVATLDSKLEHPQERQFKRDLATWLPMHRRELVCAALTLLRAYICAGRPWPEDAEVKPTRFPDWDHLVRGALMWLGESDPAKTMEDVAAVDSVRGDLSAVMAAIGEHPTLTKGTGGAFSAKLVADCAQVDGDLRSALKSVLPKDIVTTKGVSGYLKNNAGRIVGGYFIEKFHDEHAEALRFRLREAPKQTAMFQ